MTEENVGVQDLVSPSFCEVCGAIIETVDWEGDGWEATMANNFCLDCLYTYPPSLLKAVIDDFVYALGLADGGIIIFNSASITGDWVTLYADSSDLGLNEFAERVCPELQLPQRSLHFPFPRGIDIRYEDIRWCADAPWGS